MDYKICRIISTQDPQCRPYFIATKNKTSQYLANMKQKYKDYLVPKQVSTSKAFYLFEQFPSNSIKIFELERTSDALAEGRKNDYILKTPNALNHLPTYSRAAPKELTEEERLNQWWSTQPIERKREIYTETTTPKPIVQPEPYVPKHPSVPKLRKGSSTKKTVPIDFTILTDPKPSTVTGYMDLFKKYDIAVEREARTKGALEKKYLEIIALRNKEKEEVN